MKTTKILIKALNFDNLSRSITSKRNYLINHSLSNSKKDKSTSRLGRPISERNKADKKMSIKLRPKSHNHPTLPETIRKNSNTKKKMNYINIQSEYNTLTIRKRKPNVNPPTISSFALYNNSYNNNGKNSRNYYKGNYISMTNRFFTVYGNNINSNNSSSSYNSSIVNTTNNGHYVNTSTNFINSIGYTNNNNKYWGKKFKTNSVLKATIKKRIFIKNFNTRKAGNEKRIKLSGYFDLDENKEKYEELLEIALIKNYKALKVFKIWRFYNIGLKRKNARDAIKNKLNYFDCNRGRRYNEIRAFEEKIIKWFKEKEEINSVIVESENVISTIDDIYQIIKEVTKGINGIIDKGKQKTIKNNNTSNNSNNLNLNEIVSTISKAKILKAPNIMKSKNLFKSTSPGHLKLKQNTQINAQNSPNAKSNQYKIKIIFNSISSYILNLLIAKTLFVLNKFKYEIKYSFNQKEKNIISNPTYMEIKDALASLIDAFKKCTHIKVDLTLLNTFNNNFYNDLEQNEIITSGIKESYLSMYMNSSKVNFKLETRIIHKNLINDFSVLKRDRVNIENEEISKALRAIESKVLSSIKVNLQQTKFEVLKIQKRLSNIGKENLNYENFNDRINMISVQLDKETNIINKDNPIESLEEKTEELKRTRNLTELIWLIEIILIKYNILYDDFNSVLSNLSIYFSNFGNKKLLYIPQLYQELVLSEGFNYNSIKCKLLYNKFISLIQEEDNFKGNKMYNNFNQLLSYKNEIIDLYQKGNNNDITTIYFNIEKFNDNIEKIKRKFIFKVFNIPKQKHKDINDINDIIAYLHNRNNEITNFDLNDKDVYISFTFNFINKNLQRTKKNNIIENALFKFISNKTIFTTNAKNNISNLLSQYSSNTNPTDDQLIIKQINNQIVSNIPNQEHQKKNTFKLEYAKLYLLSDDDISILNQDPHLPIESISSYYTKINPKQKLLISKNQIIGIKSFLMPSHFETLTFINPISLSFHPSKKQNIYFLSKNFSKIDNAIAAALNESTLLLLSEFSSKPFIQWVNSSLSQVSINCLCLIFTNEISQLLSSKPTNKSNKKNQPHQIKKDLQLIINKYQQWLKERENFNMPIQANIVLTIINHINIIETLLNKNVNDIESFDWLKYIRHLWDQNRKEVFIECGGWTNYQMKRIISTNRILLTPDTDKVFLFNSSCFREKSASIIKVSNNRSNNIQSYREIFQEYCSLFWTEMIDVKITSSSLNEVKEVFDIATKCKLWIYLEQIDLLDFESCEGINYMIYLSKFMQLIQQEVILNDIRSDIGDKMFCLMGCVLIDDNIKNKENYLKSSSRVLNFVKPDMKYYFTMVKKFFDNKNAIGNINKVIDYAIRNENDIRNKLGSFYYDFDFFNELIVSFLNGNSNSNNNVTEDELCKFISNYGKRFEITEERQREGEDEMKREIENFFIKRKVLYTDKHIDIFKFIVKYFNENEDTIANKPVICGFGCSYIANEFNKFYCEKYVNSNNNIKEKKLLEISEIESENELRFKGDLDHREIIIFKGNIVEYNSNFKVFDLPQPKSKKLLKLFIEKLNIQISKIGLVISDEYHLSTLEFINSVFKSQQSQNVPYTYLLYSFEKWMTFLLEKIAKNKMNIYLLTNIIIHAILCVFNYSSELLKTISSQLTNLVNQELTWNFFQVPKEKFAFFDIKEEKFNSIEKYNDYLLAYIKQSIDVIPPTQKILLVISEYEMNINRRLIDDIEDNISKGNIIEKLIVRTIDKNILIPYKYYKYIRIFIGRNYDDVEIEFIKVKNNEKVINFYTNNTNANSVMKKEYIPKFEYVLSFFNLDDNINDDILKFIYSIVHLSFSYEIQWNKININYDKISDYIKIVKTILKSLTSAEIYLNNSNNLISSLFKKIFPKTKFSINKDTVNRIVIDVSNQLLLKAFISQYLESIYLKSKTIKEITNKMESLNENELFYSSNQLLSPINPNDIEKISNLIMNLFLPEQSFNEKFQKENYVSSISKYLNQIIIKKIEFTIYNLINAKTISIFNQSHLLFNFIINGTLNGTLSDYLIKSQLMSGAHQKEISRLITDVLYNYKLLISNKKEFINTKSFFLNSLIKYINKSSKNQDYSNFILEKIYLSVSNHFLLSLVLTLEIMKDNFEISKAEMDYVITYLKLNFIFPNDNRIKYKYETLNSKEKEDTNDINEEIPNNIIKSGRELLCFYQKNTNISHEHLSLLEQSLSSKATKYFYTNNVSKVSKDVDKLLYYMTFIPEQSPSIFKYLITKYLLPIYSVHKYTVNAFLKKKYISPITVKAEANINVTNFLCSLAAYYEIKFIIVRNIIFFKENIKNVNYQYIIDEDVLNVIREGMKNGNWIFISDEICKDNLMKIIWELYNIQENKVHKKFKLFLDQQLLHTDCKGIAEDMTMLLQIENENVDDLEAAHDIWVNVLEEKLLTESIMDETQKDFLDINSNLGKNNVSGITEVAAVDKSNMHNNIISNLEFSNNGSFSELNMLENI